MKYTDRNRMIVAERLSGETLEAIGSRHGITRERVHQIVKASGEDLSPEQKRAVRIRGMREWRHNRK